MVLDQTYRYVNLELDENELIKNGKHVLTAYRMQPKAGDQGYLQAAAHFAAESSTGTNVEVSTTDDFTRSVDALVYAVDEEKELIKIAYPVDLFDRNIIDGRAMIASFLTLTVGNNQGMGDILYAKMLDFYMPGSLLELFHGPATTIHDLWHTLNRDSGFIVGTIIKPKLGLRPEPFANAAYEFWLGGDFVKNDEPQGNQPFAPFRETVDALAIAMQRAQDKTGDAKIFSFNITADDHYEMLARGEYILDKFADMPGHVAFLVDGYVAGPSAVTTARLAFPDTFLHFHRAGHGAVTSAQSDRGYTNLVLAKMARLLGSSGIHVGTMGFGKMEGEREDRLVAEMLIHQEADGAHFHQHWGDMKITTPIISGGMNAVRIFDFFEHLGAW